MPRLETFKKVQIADETSIESQLQYNGATIKPRSKQGNKRQHLTKSSISLPKDENYNDQTITAGQSYIENNKLASTAYPRDKAKLVDTKTISGEKELIKLSELRDYPKFIHRRNHCS